MISSKLVAESVLSSIEQPSLESVEITQISSVERFLENSHRIVATYTDLPDVVENTGRIMYVQDEDEHYFSNGVFWSKDYSSDEGLILSETWAWGDNGNGRIGDGTTVRKSSPVSVIGGIANWSQVSAGSYHSLAIANQKI